MANKALRQIDNGNWIRSAVLQAARKILISGLEKKYEKKPLEKLAFFLNGTSYDVGQLSHDNSGELIIRISNITNPSSSYIRTTEKLEEKYRVFIGDLLVSWSASFKTIIWNGPEGILNQHIFKVTEYDGNHRGFLRHAIEATFGELQKKTVGIGMMHIRRGDFLGHEIPTPNFDVQEKISDYLDWIENGAQGQKPTLPDELLEQEQIIIRAEAIAARIATAQLLREQITESLDAFISSYNEKYSEGRTVKLNEIIFLDEEKDTIKPDGNYPQIGIKGFGKGLFARGTLSGTQTTYKWFNRLYYGAIVLSQVKGWEGAIGVCDSSLAGKFASPEYRTFRCISGKALPEYLSALISTPYFYLRLKNLTRGVGGRRERIRPELFLELEIPMPNIERQKKAVEIYAKFSTLRRLQSATGEELSALLPSVLDKAFKGEL